MNPNQQVPAGALILSLAILFVLFLLARWVYDLDAHEGLDRLLGFEYRACCWRVRLLARRYLVNGTGQQDTAFMFQVQLSGLAGVGPATDAFLGTAIRGYSPPSLSR